MLRRLLAVGPLVVFALAGRGCASPTLPLPPPAVPGVLPGADADHVRLVAPCSGAEGGAIIVVVNQNPAVANDLAVSGARANPCGAWDATVYAHKGDVLDVTQEFGTTASPPTTVQLQ
jgi:hypothetical protein